MTFNKLSSFTTSLWNQKTHLLSADNIGSCLHLTSKITTVAMCILPKDVLPASIFPVLTVVDSLKDVLPACIKALSKDQSIKTILKCSGIMTLALTPCAIQFSSLQAPKPSNDFQSSTYRDAACQEGSEADLIFSELKKCVFNGYRLNYCTYNDNPKFSQTVRITEQHLNGIQSVLQFENGDHSIVRFTPDHFTVSYREHSIKLTSDQTPYEDTATPIDQSLNELEMEVWLTVDKTARFVGCRFKTMIPKSLSFTPIPYCFTVFSSKDSYVTCLGDEPSRFSIKDAFVQFEIDTSAPHYKKVYTTEEDFPCSKGFIPKEICQYIQEPYT